MTTRIFFVRHGEVNNPEKIVYGRLPKFALSELGKKEIVQTTHLLSKNKIAAIYASPLLRTRQSAEIISNVLHLPIHYAKDLLEINSPMEGKLIEYVLRNTVNYNVFATDENMHGETIEDVEKRIKKFINEIKKKHVGKNVVVVTHGDPIMLAKTQAEGLPIEINSIRPAKGYIGHGEIYTAEFNSQ
jgi:broad specificity phosphatase PhoE